MPWLVFYRALLLSLVALALPRYVTSSPRITVVYPENHSVWPVDLETGTFNVSLQLTVDGFQVPRDGFLRVTGDIFGKGSDAVYETTNINEGVELMGMTPGSFFWSFTLVHTNGSVAGHTTLHIEVVVPQDIALPQWRYTLSERERRRRVLFNLPISQETTASNRTGTSNSTLSSARKHRICFMGSTTGQFDGAKKIWLQAIAALPRSEWDVQFVSFQDIVESSAFTQALRRLDVPIHNFPLNVQLTDLITHGVDPSDVMSRLIDYFKSEFGEGSVSIDVFRQRVQNLQPPFAAAVWKQSVYPIFDLCADAVMACASSNGPEDRFLVESARVAGVRAIVMELANLNPVPMKVDALIGPSHYALNHPSLVRSVDARQRYVLTTGINTMRFRPRPQHKSSISAAAEERQSKLFTIGYVGRLATEKSLGLFLQAARLIAMSCRAKCRFRLIGDGPQRDALEALAGEWGISDLVEFTGGIYTEAALAEAMQELDVVISLCFHETLGIAPLEAMSCGVPVVGFQSGGVGEYLEDGVNGLTIESATAESIRDSVMRLYRDDRLREKLGIAARRTVVDRFSYESGARQYVTLYERLARLKRH